VADPTQIAIREEKLLCEIRDHVAAQDPELAQRLAILHPSGGVPTSGKMPNEYAQFLGEAVLVLYRQLEEVKEAQKPRKRGRPPKNPKDKTSK
jgi:hypothetical protein